ncbi:MAG TPA: alkaline phosphatase family protein [Segeticoccus sp.]|uniref:alkaline phosphatase family protein n=1 Tax=Segeticoccus sp. TaxID=2706531 RepID=UPI002D7E99C9|nr:alkaline phosphatase family protein [Segeticoccus sp.]HET8598825.1 alkaline phosphatase family protein [Segeticoccus sp.]
MRLSRNASIAALSAASLVALGTTAMAAAPSHGGDHHRTAPLDHVYVIMLENHSQSSVIGDPNAPFMTHLAKKYAMANRYYGVTHPSMPNYIASIAGDNFGIQDDNDQNVVNLDRPNLVDQLEKKHVSWGAYMDTLPADKLARFGPTLSDGTVIQLYAKKHNPFVLFDDIKNSPRRMSHVRDYSALKQDLNSRHAPQFVWISPNQCHDMHGGVTTAVPGHPETPCPYGSTKDDPNDAALKQKADAFVKNAVNTIMSSRSWTRNSAIVIVTDENDYTGNEETGGWESAAGCCDSPYVQAADPRISPDWPGGTYGGGLIPAIIVRDGLHHVVDHTAYNHYSLLTTIEDNWGLGHIGHAGDTAGGVVPMWKSFGVNRHR